MKTIKITRICNTIAQRWIGDDDNEEMEEQEVLLKKGEVLKGDYLGTNKHASKENCYFHIFGILEGDFEGATICIPTDRCTFEGHFIRCHSEKKNQLPNSSYVEEVYQLNGGQAKIYIMFTSEQCRESYSQLHLWGENGWNLFLKTFKKDMQYQMKKNVFNPSFGADREHLLIMANNVLGGS